MHKIIKKNQVILSVIALMLVAAGYLNYTAIHANDNSMATSSQTNAILEMAGIGDAQLVSGNAVDENTVGEIITNENVQSNGKTVDNNEITPTNTKITDSSQYFISSRLSRDTMYSQMIETYEKILSNENISAEQKAVAQTEITNINSTKNAIMIAENLIKNKGFEDLVIFVNDTSISVIIKSDELSKEEIAQIQNIITRELKADINNIHISNKE